MNRRWKCPEVPDDRKTVTIYTVKYEHDLEFTVSPSEAQRIIDSFMHDDILRIVEDETTYYINTKNIINIEVE